MRPFRNPARSLPLFLLPLLLTLEPDATAAQEAPGVRVSGVVSATLFAQDHGFGFTDGQGAQWALAFGEDGWYAGGDARNTRVTLSATGPSLPEGWGVSGVVELDFFGRPEPLRRLEELSPRLRLAYADLQKGGTTLRIGQAWAPLFGIAPASLAHLAFPLGQGSTGVVGWRHPGIFLHQALGEGTGSTAAQLHLGAFYGSGLVHSDAGVGGTPPRAVSPIPQLEGKLQLSGTLREVPWTAYVAGHIDEHTAAGALGSAGHRELTGKAIAAGGRITPGPFTIHGSAYAGRAIGDQLGQLAQVGDISGRGGWAQAGYALTPRWSAWIFAGREEADREEVVRALGHGRTGNRSTAAMLRYSLGVYAVGAEWLRSSTEWAQHRTFGNGTFPAELSTTTANQLSVTVYYAF